MNSLEARLDYPLNEHLPAAAQCTEVVQGLYWIRMPLPFALDHINLWLLDDDIDGRRGYTLIDCGIGDGATAALWDRLIAEHFGGLPILRVLCTHAHPDHIGMAQPLTERFDASFWMTGAEYTMGRVCSAMLAGIDGNAAADFYLEHGLAPDRVAPLRTRNKNDFGALVPAMPLAFRRIEQHVEIGGRRFDVIIGTGHSPEHAALYCEADSILIAGDMVLPRISTNCSVFELEPLSNPVQWYLDSLTKFERCQPDTLVLPSHGRPFRHLHERLRQLREHHQQRLEQVRAACQERPRHAADIMALMFSRALDAQQVRFAIGEALAHLHALWYRGELVRRRSADGVYRFAAA